MKILQNRWTAFLFIELGIVLALLVFVCFGTNSPEAKTSAVAPFVSANTASEEVEETVTLTPPSDGVKYGYVYHEWSDSEPSFIVGPAALDLAPGETVAGYQDHWNAGGFGKSKTQFRAEWRGLLWFDLSGITSKPSLPFVTSATLKFKRIDTEAKNENAEKISRTCDDTLEIALKDWMKKLPPESVSAPFTPPVKIGSCSDCSLDVRSVVNNWVKGSEDRNGFVIVGEDEGFVAGLFPQDNAVCVSRYGDFSLTVTYKYNKPPIILVAPPEKPVIQGRPVIAGNPDLFSTRTNVALATNGGVATASSVFPASPASYANDGDRKAGAWVSATATFPQWLQIDFAGVKNIAEIDVFTLQDNYTSPVEPTETLTFSKYGLTGFEVQYWDGSAWVNIPGGNVSGNNLVWRQFKFPAIKTSKIRVLSNSSPDPPYSRLCELEAWTP